MTGIGINAILTDGNRVLKDIGYNELISINGYQKNENNFKTKNGKGYIEVPKVNNATAIYIETNNAPKTDLTVQVDLHMNNGLISKNVKQSLWNANEHYFVVDVMNEGVSSYIIHINHDLELSRVYYLQPDTNVIQKRLIFVISLPFTFLVALLLVFTHISENIYIKILSAFQSFNDKVKSDRKGIYQLLLLLLLSILLVFILNLLFVTFVSNEFSKKALLFISNIVFLLDIFILFLKKKKVRIEVIGCIIILSMGAMISFSEPTSLGMVWDDETHFSRTVSYTHIIDKKQSEANIVMSNMFASNALAHDTYSLQANELKEIKLNNLYRNKLYRYYNDQSQPIFKYDRISYIVPATGIIIARGLHLPYNMIVAFGRFADVIMLSICAYYAIKNLERGKIVLVLILILPTVTMTAANYNYDTWILGFTLLGASYFIKELEKDCYVGKNSVIKMIAFTLLGIAPKLIYFPIFLLYFFMPKRKFKNKQDYMRYFWSLFLSMLIPFVFVFFNNIVKMYISGKNGKVTGDMRGGIAGVNAGGQILYILHNPIQALKIFTKFLMVYLNPFKQGASYTTSMSYLNIQNSITISQLGNCFVLFIFINSLLTNISKKSSISTTLKILSILLYFGVGALCALALYISFTPVAYKTVLGCQGRYLLPVLFFPLYMNGNWNLKGIKNNAFVGSANTITVILFLGVTLQQYWIHFVVI